MSNRYSMERERLEHNSINKNSAQAQQRRQVYRKRTKKVRTSMKKVVIGILLVLALAVGAKKVVDNYKPYFDGSYINQSYSIGHDSIHDNTHRTANNEGYWYDVYSIAGLYNDSLDFDSFVFGAYSGMQTNIIRNMDDLFWQLKMRDLTDYNKFTDYVMGMGCVKVVDGQCIADTAEWKELMRDHIRIGNELGDAYTKFGKYDGSMDLDIYINKVYETVGWSKKSKTSCMDELMQDLYINGYTSYPTFLAYCQSKGFVKEKDGVMVVDESAYEKGYKKYLSDLDEYNKLQGEIDQFRAKASSEGKGLGK